MMHLAAPPGYSTVSALSTLVTYMYYGFDVYNSLADAESDVLTVFGLNASDISLATADPYTDFVFKNHKGWVGCQAEAESLTESFGAPCSLSAACMQDKLVQDHP
jgi:hypothetical protein